MNLSNNTFISVSFVDDSEMKKLNKKHRGKDTSTDVLSFNINEKTDDGRYYLGDIIINKQQAKRQAKEYENSFEEEVAALVKHGVLHLFGVHHEGDN